MSDEGARDADDDARDESDGDGAPPPRRRRMRAARHSLDRVRATVARLFGMTDRVRVPWLVRRRVKRRRLRPPNVPSDVAP